jgi:hypothetical protein
MYGQGNATIVGVIGLHQSDCARRALAWLRHGDPCTRCFRCGALQLPSARSGTTGWVLEGFKKATVGLSLTAEQIPR